MQLLAQPVAVTLARIDAAEIDLHHRVAVDDRPRPARRAWAAGCRRPAPWPASAQALDGAPHREHGGVQDVERVDLLDAGLRPPRSTAPWRGSGRTAARAAARVSTLESARPRMRLRSSRITAAATTGPASGPRPASSTPAIRPGGSQARRGLLSLARTFSIASAASVGVSRSSSRAARRNVAARRAPSRGAAQPVQRGLRPALRAWRRPAAARAPRIRRTGCSAGRPRAAAACAA